MNKTFFKLLAAGSLLIMVRARCNHISDELWRWRANSVTTIFKNASCTTLHTLNGINLSVASPENMETYVNPSFFNLTPPLLFEYSLFYAKGDFFCFFPQAQLADLAFFSLNYQPASQLATRNWLKLNL